MGEKLIRFYREKAKYSWKIAFFSAFVIGLIVHMFRFVNVMPNHDALFNFWSSQNMVASGRWFLGIACTFSSFFDLPWMIGVLSLLYMSLTATVVTEIFDLKNPVLIMLCSGLFVSFPAITETMFFEFTADGYMLAMLLSAISVLLTKIERIRKNTAIYAGLSAICICLACGIYQVYISFAYVLAVCYFMTELLENRYETRDYIRWVITQVFVYLLAVVTYYLIWQLAMRVQCVEATTYNGIDRALRVDFAKLMSGAKECVFYFVKFFVEWNVFELGFTPYTTLNLLFIGLSLYGVLTAIVKSGCIRRIVHLILILLCMITIPFICCVYCFNLEGIEYTPRLLQSVCVLYIFVAVLYERWLHVFSKNMIMFVLLAIVFNNSVIANTCYNFMHQCYEKSYAMAVELSTRIHLLDTGNERQVAIVGRISGFAEHDKLDESKLRSLGSLKKMKRIITNNHINVVLFLYNNLDFELSYYKMNNAEVPRVTDLGDTPPVPDGWYFYFPVVTEEEREYFESSEEVAEMPPWPAADSVKTIGDTIVVKLS